MDRTFGEQIVITPRNFAMKFRCIPEIPRHYAMIGIGIVEEEEPLYYDAVNERGLGIAGLNFPGLAVYHSQKEGMDNVASFELIPWLLGQCADVEEALICLNRLNLADIAFSAKFPPAPLHWMISDRDRTVVAEPREEGLRIYDNPARVLTNNPAFDYHLLNLTDYMGLTSEFPVNRFSAHIPLRPYCLGMGALGLPGELSSTSRFVRSAFIRAHALVYEDTKQARRKDDRETFSVTQFFHILGSVEQTDLICYSLRKGQDIYYEANPL